MAWRRDNSAFDFHFFRFFNSASPNNTMSSGLGKNAAGVLNMTIQEVYSSSENWILYFQSGVYFIRNYDYGGDLQIGVDSKTATQPRLLKRNGTLGQQWTLTKAEDGKSWLLTNGLLGKDLFLGLDGAKPVMTADKTKGTVWGIEMNESAGLPAAGNDLITSVQNLESPPVSSSSSSSSPTASQSATPANSQTAPPTTTNTGLLTSPTSSSANGITSSVEQPSQSLSGGAIAGIAIGALALIALLLGAGLFLLARRKKANKARAKAAYTDPNHPVHPLSDGQVYEAPSHEYSPHASNKGGGLVYAHTLGPQELAGSSSTGGAVELDSQVPELEERTEKSSRLI